MLNYTLVRTGNGPVIVSWERYSCFTAMLARLGANVQQSGRSFHSLKVARRRVTEERTGAVVVLEACEMHRTALKVCLGGTSRIEVRTLAEASAEVRADIEARGIGASGWYDGTAGDVRDESEALVARVSYNGRVWTPVALGAQAHEIVGAALHGVSL